MKTKIFLASVIICVFITFAFTGCTKEKITFDGYYSGSFTYQGQVKFDALIINGNNFEEAASGGALYQKFPCLTKGTYKIKGDIISFSTSVEPDCLCDDCLLKGEYKLIQSGNTLEFQKEARHGMQRYLLTFVE